MKISYHILIGVAIAKLQRAKIENPRFIVKFYPENFLKKKLTIHISIPIIVKKLGRELLGC